MAETYQQFKIRITQLLEDVLQNRDEDPDIVDILASADVIPFRDWYDDDISDEDIVDEFLDEILPEAETYF